MNSIDTIAPNKLEACREQGLFRTLAVRPTWGGLEAPLSSLECARLTVTKSGQLCDGGDSGGTEDLG